MIYFTNFNGWKKLLRQYISFTEMPKQLPDAIRKIIGKKLRHYRKEDNLSLRDLAAIAGIGHSWIGKLEKGQINFQIDSLMRLLEVLEVQPKELFNFDLPYDD